MCNEIRDFEERKKDLFQQMLKKEDVAIVLKLLGEDGTKGSEQFQRAKLKKILNSKVIQRKKKLSPWEYLKWKIRIHNLTEGEKNDIVRYLNDSSKKFPSFVRYFTLMIEDEDFFINNFDNFVKNVEEEKDFLSGLVRKYTEDEVEQKIYKKFDKDEVRLKNSLSQIIDLIPTEKEKFSELCNLLERKSLEEYQCLFQNLISEGYPEELINLAYAFSGECSGKVRVSLYYLGIEELVKRYIKYTLIEKSNINNEQGESLNDKGVRKQLKKVAQDKKKLEEELEQIIYSYEEEKRGIVEKISSLEAEIRGLTIKDNASQKMLEDYKRKLGGYTLNLADDLSIFRVVVISKSPLLYAPIIFPELTFLGVHELASKISKQKINLVIIQKNGLSFKEYLLIQQMLNEKNILFVNIDAKEERSLIMNISVIMQQKIENSNI